MLSARNKLVVINVLDSALGVGTSMKGNEQAHHCPFCHHHKKKLQINVETQYWHCWVCDSKGRSIQSLLNRLNVDRSDIGKIISIYGEYTPTNNQTEVEKVVLKLPKEFKSLYQQPKSINPIYNQAIGYLLNRGITMDEVLKYNIGYCEDGLYGGRVIIPSYSEEGELNYFIARSFYKDSNMKYKNPPVSRNVIVFDNQINWNEPITLVEGVFDSFAVKRNVIPILGKFLPKTLKEKIFEKGVKEINILLDSDAVDDSTQHANYFIQNGIKVTNIIPNGNSDAGELGFDKVNELLKETEESGWDDLILSKLNNL
jgi:DNA primase